MQRQLLLESLEDRRLLAAGPRLAGIQPNNSVLFSFDDPSANVRSVAPRELNIRFDENQQIVNTPANLSAIRITRSGFDGVFGNANDVQITPGFIGVTAAPDQNEVIVRFAETLPDDIYRIEIFGAGSAAPLQNSRNEAYVATLSAFDNDNDSTKDTIEFSLDLGAQVVAVVPQPVRRVTDPTNPNFGGIVQARNQVEVYFNDDDLYVENDDLGNPTARSAENPAFYQLIFTADTVRNTDDVTLTPLDVTYDAAADRAVLTFAQPLDALVNPDTGQIIGPGTFRLRVGTNESAPLAPQRLTPNVLASSDFNSDNEVVLQFTSVRPDEQDISIFVTSNDLGDRVVGVPNLRVNIVANAVFVDLNSRPGQETTGQEVIDAINQHPVVGQLIAASLNRGSSAATVGDREINYSPIRLTGVGSSFDTATNLSDDTDLGAVLVVTSSGFGFNDGDFFTVTDAANQTRLFEFDSNEPPVVNQNGAIRIPFSSGLTQEQMTRTIAATINGASFGAQATVFGNRIRFEGERFIDLDGGVDGLTEAFQNKFDEGQVIEVVRGGDTFDGSDANANVFTITDTNNISQEFEFDSGFFLNVPAGGSITDGEEIRIRFDDTVNPPTEVVFEFESGGGTGIGTVPIAFTATDSQAMVVASVIAAIRTKVNDGSLVEIAPLNLGSGRIHLGGTAFHTLTTPNGTSVTQTGTPGPQRPGAIAVRLVPDRSFTATDVAASIGAAINRAGFNVTATVIANRVTLAGDLSIAGIDGLVGLQRSIQPRFDAGPVLTLNDRTSGLTSLPDGATFSIIDDRGTRRNFEIDRNAVLNDPTAERVTLTVNPAAPQQQQRDAAAQAIAAAINRVAVTVPAFRARATALGDRIYLTNDRDVVIGGTLRGLSAASQGIIISSSIDAGSYSLDFPGNENDPGHRNIPDEVGQGGEQHIDARFGADGRDNTPGVTTILYNFKAAFAQDTNGNPLQNAITQEQQRRAREAFKLWGEDLGVQFIESADQGLTIATGDLSGLDPTAATVLDYPSNDFRVRIDPTYANGLLLMDSANQWNDQFGGDWFINAMIGIGSMLGLNRANDLPGSTLLAFQNSLSFLATPLPNGVFPSTINSVLTPRGLSVTNQTFPTSNLPTPEPIFPGNHDIVHGQSLYRPDGVDIDLYRFTIDVAAGQQGLFTAETFAERLPNSSLLDTVVSVYRENPDGTRELIARNDDYYSRDSFIELQLGAGVYYIGVSSSGNTDFDPTIEDSGIGGTSQGKYDLRLNFRAGVESEGTLRDHLPDNTPDDFTDDIPRTTLDGDADGTPGGVFNFWFQTQTLNRVLRVTGPGSTISDGQVLTVINNVGAERRITFDRTDQAGATCSGANCIKLIATTPAATIAQAIANIIRQPINGVVVEATANGDRVVIGRVLTSGELAAGIDQQSERALRTSANFSGIAIGGRTLYVDKAAGPDADGSQRRPFNNLANPVVANALGVAQPGDIVRVVGNGGTDQDLESVKDNFAYEVGFSGSSSGGASLTDGTTMEVPKGVTVMVEPGTIFKLRRSRIGVGSSSLTVDRSGGVLQVLGTPDSRVIFTSWLDESIGRDNNPPTTVPGRGDWGGIVFRADLDRAESRPSLEDEGIFLNYVNNTDILYGGGGNVVIESQQQVVNPIQIVQTRPTISYNNIMFSADAALSASPDSFDETNFHAPRFQSRGEFTSDYSRVGPDIYGNRLINNSTNGLFIRIETPAGNALRPFTVSGRFDDTDVVHVLSENLIIQGSLGEPFLDLSRPAVGLVTFAPIQAGTLATGTYAYKVTYVDINGFEGRPSLATSTFTITPAQAASGIGSVRLNQLPPVNGDFVARRIYRTNDPVNGTYQLVQQINGSDTVFVDTGTSLGDPLRRDPPVVSNVTLTAQPRGSLAVGTYNYRIVFVDALGREDASSDPTLSLTIAGAPNGGGIVLNNIPAATGAFVTRRIYRSRVGGIAPYELVAQIDATSPTYLDDGFTLGGQLDPSTFGVIRARPSARLAVDPGTVIKLEGARIETKFGGQLIAEGLDGQEIIFTSRLDDAFGAGGTFDTNDDDNRGVNENRPNPGDWSGLYFGPLSRLSLDHAQLSFGGGTSKLEGNTRDFNVIEIHQAAARVANSVIQDNANGVGGDAELNRFGRGFNLPSTIFVRGAQPVIINNIIRNNVNPPTSAFNPANGLGARDNAAITINLNSLTNELISDPGRSTGLIDRLDGFDNNYGPLVRGNRLDGNGLNGLVVRGEEVTTQSVWDDTDIVHIVTDRYDDARFGWLFDEILIPDLHTFGGVRLQSSATESLVVKLEDDEIKTGQRFNLNPTNGAGFTATGRPLDIDDRIGGTLHVIGQPGFPVVLTSIHDDTAGAGERPDGTPQVDTNNNGIATTPAAGDWRSLRLDQNSNDRNSEIVIEMERPDETAPGRNAEVGTSQFLGELTTNEKSGNSAQRVGFEVHGFLNEPNDVDVYSFRGVAGTEVFVDIDLTALALDTVVELLDSNGNVLARSNDTLREAAAGRVEFIADNLAPNLVNPLQRSPQPYTPTHVSGLPKDFYSTNPLDAGMRISLPGNAGTAGTYYVRVASNHGLTSGVYQLQLRLSEFADFPGSTVRYADIRYAQNGVEVYGLPKHSPLLGDVAEDEENDPNLASNNSFFVDPISEGRRPQDVGNLLASDRATFSIGGSIASSADVDFYSFDVRYEEISEQSVHHATAVFDLDYADGLNRPDTTLSVFDSNGRLVLIGRDSNIAEDRPGPLGGSDLADLSRGTVGPGDPFIGPAELPEGNYRVAVTPNSLAPSVLTQNPELRLEPINSVRRIAEDHIAESTFTTAEPPVVPVLLDPNFVAIGATNLWHVTQNRSDDITHGINPSFDGSRSFLVSGAFRENEPNDTLLTAQNIDNGPWSVNFDSDFAFNSTNNSTTSPHITIQGTGDGTFDYYSFTVQTTNEIGVFDIDYAWTGDPASLDSELFIYDPTTGLQVPSFFDGLDPFTTSGGGGSIDGPNSSLTPDAYLITFFPSPGTYIVGVGRFDSVGSPGGITGNAPLLGQRYTLNISLQDHALGGGGIMGNGASSFYFGTDSTSSVPQAATGQLVSNPFSLAGYSAQDLPNLYFNYYLNDNAASDFFRVYVDDGSATPTLVASSNSTEVSAQNLINIPQTVGGWRQLRLSLGAFAGKSDLRLRFEYLDNSAAPTEGVYIDDLIIGFAERGEMVTFPPPGAQQFPSNVSTFSQVNTPSSVASAGDYQLEIRSGSTYGRSLSNSNVSLLLTSTIDTNDRLAQQTTLIAPRGSEVVEGQTFTISDSVNSVTFEYEDPQIGDGASVSGRIEIPFRRIDPASLDPQNPNYLFLEDYEIAALIRNAINSPQVQTRFDIRAALADGTVTGTAGRGNRVNLFGNAIVAQPPSFGIVRAADGTPQTTNDANQLRNALLGTNILAIGPATFTGSSNSAGFFEGGDALLGMSQGIVLSTGDVTVAEGPNDSSSSTGRASGRGDLRLDTAFGLTGSATTRDASILEFQFEIDPASLLLNRNDIALNFVFASEEYNEAIGMLTDPTDIVAILIDGVNVAVVPVAGMDRPVSVNSINGGKPFDPSGAGGVNPGLFRNNESTSGGAYLAQFGYDGFTARLTARFLNLAPGPHTILIAIADVNDEAGDSAVFLDANSLIAYDADIDPTTAFERDPTGILNIRHEGFGDQNRLRDQGQVLIHSNTITDSADFAIVTESGQRDSIDTSLVGGGPVPRLQSNVGPTKRLLELNDLQNAGLIGGFTPGVVIENNTISGEGLGGVHVGGNLTPLELTVWPSDAEGLLGWESGDAFCDGDVFSLTVGRQTVVFEFEDVAGSASVDTARPCWIGSGSAGGNGWTTGRVPVFYRRTIPGGIRGYLPIEMARAIKEAIDNSQLIENQTTYGTQVYVTSTRAPLRDGLDEVAVYVENVAHFDESSHGSIPSIFETQRFLPIGYAAEPLVAVVNNTIYGNDGSASFAAQAPTEPNDTLAVATQTLQGRAHNPEAYIFTSFIGDTNHFPGDQSKDVDFYQFQLDINDRVTVSVDSGNSVDTVLRLFDATGRQVALNDNGVPGTIDPLIDFTATSGGTYYVAVSGVGNDEYSAVSLADRNSSSASGAYTITVNVQAPRQFVVDLKDLLGSGAMLNITDLAQRTVSITTGGASNTGIAVRNLVAAINAAGLTGVRASTVGNRTWNYHLRDGGFKDYERYVLIEGAVKVEGLANTIAELIPSLNSNEDQVLRETGILVTEASTPTLLNNVLANLRNGIIETGAYRDINDRFHHRDTPLHPLVRPNTNLTNTHPLTTVKVGQLFQDNQFGNQGISLPPNSFGLGPNVGIRGNVPEVVERYDALIDTSDFNIPVASGIPLFVNAADAQFFPARFAPLIDSSIDSLSERSEFQAILGSVEI
ncbi:MAG: choice-of-anchor L domain-containing protein, partial [Planctomycetota bacterium]